MHRREGGGGGGGGEVPPGYCIFWMGAQHPKAPLGYQQRLDSASWL